MRTLLFALVLAACVSPPPPVAPSPPEPPPAPPPTPLVTALPSMLPPGQPAMPEMPAMAPTAPAASPIAVAAPVAGRVRHGALEHSMTNCPTAVKGAVTRASNTESGVDLTITADDPASQRQIVELAARHEQIGDPDGSAPRHTGLHGGPGGIGHCPVIHDATTVTFTRLRRGAVIHLRALLPSDVARVQAIANARLAALVER
jgi:hypothetical protein